MSEIHHQRVEALRAVMAGRGWDAVVISGSDPHSSEYPAPRWKQVEWLSGFTGEAGDLVVTRDHAGLWTDSRYFIQAVSELEGSGIVLHKTRVPDAVGIPQWLASHVRTVALDGTCFTADAVREIEEALSSAVDEPEDALSAPEMQKKPEVVNVPDLLDIIWNGRPDIPQTPVTTLDEATTGESRLQKIVWLRKFLMKENCDSILLTALDEIAWMLNVRGQDIEYNPLVISYLLVTLDDVFWYVKKGTYVADDPDTVDSETEIKADGVTICRYDALADGLAQTGGAGRIYVDPATLNYNVYSLILACFDEKDMVSGSSPVILRKAVKNDVEIAGMKEAFHVDGIAMERFLFWLDTALKSGQKITEWEASQKLTSLRAEIPGYRGNSFCNISAYGQDAALPHYSTPEHGSAVIEPQGLYLVDSGGQYLFGTTDITRTVPVGECSPLEKEDYTLVLKGMIALSRAVFPKGTAGCQLDVLAREPLWRMRRNFGHGTGHGLGFYLCVHEGPQDIRQNFNRQPLLPGMVTSNEPGIYREGQHGIRHENILLCVEAGRSGFGEWLRFETLTVCHIDTSAVIKELMTADEIEWLNAYNRHVYETLSPELPQDISEWLRIKTMSI